jgi:nucleoside-diphosphate-sugar epimerase
LRAAVAGADVVFHLAALIAIPYSYVASRSYVETNVLGTLNVLEAARDAGVPLVVHTSTSEVYGTAQTVPIDERHPLQGQSPYSATKIGADKIAESFHRSFGLPVITLRPFNTFGPRQSARAVIPTIATQLVAGGPVALGNVHPTRDFTYVDDTVEAFVLAADAPDAIGRTLNVGTGKEISIGELALRIASIVGGQAEIEHDEHRVRPPASEVERLCADASLARSLLGWEPRVSLDEGLTRTVAWLREHLELYRTGVYAV